MISNVNRDYIYIFLREIHYKVGARGVAPAKIGMYVIHTHLA